MRKNLNVIPLRLEISGTFENLMGFCFKGAKIPMF